MNRIPSVKLVMTPFPYSIDAEESLHEAHEMMEQHRIRHLPVTRGGKLAGVVSDRDVAVARMLLKAHGSAELSVWSICTHDPFVVDIDERVDRVADAMADRRISSAIVAKNDKLAGILTSTDVYRAYAETLRCQVLHSTGHDAA